MPYYVKHLEAIGPEIMEETRISLLNPDLSEEERMNLLNQYNTVLLELAKAYDKTKVEQLYLQEGTVGIYKMNI
jgi:phosphate uptake regulator